MKTEPVFNDEFSGENSDGTLENSESQDTYLCPRCAAFFIALEETLRHCHNEMNHLFTLELTRRRILDLCKNNTFLNLHHLPIPSPTPRFPFDPFMFPPMPLILNSTPPPFPSFFDLDAENIHGYFHDHEMMAIFSPPPPPPPPPPPSPERDTNVTLDFLSIMDHPFAPTMGNAEMVGDGHLGTAVPIPVAAPPVFSPPAAPEAASSSEPALAPPMMAPAAVTVKMEEPDELDLDLKL